MKPNSHLVMFTPTVTKLFIYFQGQGPRKLSNQHDDWTSSIQTKLNYLTTTFILHSPLLMANQQLNQNINPVLLHKVHLTNSVLFTTSKGVIIHNFSPIICKYCAIIFIQVLSHSFILQDWQIHCVMQFLFWIFPLETGM